MIIVLYFMSVFEYKRLYLGNFKDHLNYCMKAVYKK